MRFIIEPRYDKKYLEKYHQDALDLMHLDSFDIGKENCIRRIYSMYKFIEKSPGTPDSLEESIYFYRLANAYQYFLAEAIGWKVGFIIFREKKPEDDVMGIVSPQYEYAVYVGDIPFISHRKKNDYFVELYERIISGDLPPSRPGKFLGIVNFLFVKTFPEYCYTVDEEKQQKMGKALSASLKLIDATCDDSGNLMNITPIIALQRLEKHITERKIANRDIPKQAYLFSLSQLFGQCINWLCGFQWGLAWFDGMHDELVIYRPDKRYYLKPSKIIRAALTSNSPTCNLLSYYERIRDGILPEPECDRPEEII